MDTAALPSPLPGPEGWKRPIRYPERRGVRRKDSEGSQEQACALRIVTGRNSRGSKGLARSRRHRVPGHAAQGWAGPPMAGTSRPSRNPALTFRPGPPAVGFAPCVMRPGCGFSPEMVSATFAILRLVR